MISVSQSGSTNDSKTPHEGGINEGLSWRILMNKGPSPSIFVREPQGNSKLPLF